MGSPAGGIEGYGISNNATDPDHDIDIAIGSCLDDTQVAVIASSAKRKLLDAVWASGNNAGLLDTGAIAADTVYAVYAIVKADESGDDFLASTSFTAPTMPTDYVYKRRIGFVITDGSANIIQFTQTGSHFSLHVPPQLVNDSTITGGTLEAGVAGVPYGLASLYYQVSNATLGAADDQTGYISHTDGGTSALSGNAAFAFDSATSLDAQGGMITAALDSSGEFNYGATEVSGSATALAWLKSVDDLALGWGA